MKIGFLGVDLPEGKVKYADKRLLALAEKDKPKKVSSFFAEFIKENFEQADAVVVRKDRILDLLIYDMEKIDARIARCPDAAEKKVLERCMGEMEKEVPLCDIALAPEEKAFLKDTSLYSLGPVVRVEGTEDVNTVISAVLDAGGYMFFYTTGPKESHAWLVRRGADIVECAGKIHTDLARGFIKGDVVSFDDYMNCHNFNDCRAKGLIKMVDRGYKVQPGEIIEIRFNV